MSRTIAWNRIWIAAAAVALALVVAACGAATEQAPAATAVAAQPTAVPAVATSEPTLPAAATATEATAAAAATAVPAATALPTMPAETPTATASATQAAGETPAATPSATQAAGGTPTVAAGEAEVEMEDLQFRPNVLTVRVGTTVKFANKDRAEHTATSDTGVFDSGLLGKGEEYFFTFTEAGEYPYYCRPHGGPGGVGMSGLIIVVP